MGRYDKTSKYWEDDVVEDVVLFWMCELSLNEAQEALATVNSLEHSYGICTNSKGQYMSSDSLFGHKDAVNAHDFCKTRQFYILLCYEASERELT